LETDDPNNYASVNRNMFNNIKDKMAANYLFFFYQKPQLRPAPQPPKGVGVEGSV
jgi:hypothetical protein